MKQQIAIISNLENVVWLENIREKLSQLGEIRVVDEREVDEQNGRLLADLILIDSSSILQVQAVELVKHLKEKNPATPQIVVTASPTWRRARNLLLAGASDYLKQTDIHKLVASCAELLQAKQTGTDL